MAMADHINVTDVGLSLAVGPRQPSARIRKPLLLDAYSTRTLACVRSWGKKGIAFAVGGESRWDMSLFSRYTNEKFVYTSPKRDVSKFIQDLNHYSREFAADCVLPTSEAAIMACSQYRTELACVPIIPSEREIEAVFSKANVLRTAQSLGIAVPKTVQVSDWDIQSADISGLSLPIVIKSESSEVMLSTHTETSLKTFYAFTRKEVEQECRSRCRDGRSVLLQEFIDGYGVGISGVFDEGRPLALIGHRRVRESNPFGGPSALAETIEIEPRLLDATIALFRTVAFSGPAMAEFKIDRRTGQPYLMEVNGRFWGTVLLAPAAGLDIPYLYWKMLNGIEIRPEETGYELGLRGRYFVGDTKCLALCLLGKSDRWPGLFPSRLSATKSYFASFFDKRTTDLLFTREDPVPFFARMLQG